MWTQLIAIIAIASMVLSLYFIVSNNKKLPEGHCCNSSIPRAFEIIKVNQIWDQVLLSQISD